MKKVLVLILIIFSIVCIVGCSGNDDKGNDKNPDLGTPDSGIIDDNDQEDNKNPDSGTPDSGIIDDNEQEDNKNPDSGTPDSGNPDNYEEDIEVNSQLKSEELTEDLKNTFVSAYIKSISHKIETVDENNIIINKYYGTIGKAHIVSMYDKYSEVYPNDAYTEKIKNFEFSFTYTTNTYVIFDGVLYTPKQAFEEKIINFSDLCLLFGLHTSGLDTFTKNDYDNIMNVINDKELNLISKYYGKYNGHCAVSMFYLGLQTEVVFEETHEGITFSYGTFSSRIRLISENGEHTIKTALENNVITKEDLYDLFEMHTKSAEINDQIIETILTAAYNLCLKYKEDFMKEVKYEDCELYKYYGKYDDSYIFDIHSYNWINFTKTDATEEEIIILQYGFSAGPYVLNNGVIYTLYGAVNKGIITEELAKLIK